MVIFHSYVSLPEGRTNIEQNQEDPNIQKNPDVWANEFNHVQSNQQHPTTSSMLHRSAHHIFGQELCPLLGRTSIGYAPGINGIDRHGRCT